MIICTYIKIYNYKYEYEKIEFIDIKLILYVEEYFIFVCINVYIAMVYS